MPNSQLKSTKQCWSDMKQRCSNPKLPQYKNYGGRGITVCARWLESFENFLVDMGEKPLGLTIDRINVDGNYEPQNCRWLSKAGQQKNRRNCQIFTHNGMTMTMREWAKLIGRHEATLSARVRRGYSLEMILSPAPLRFGCVKAIAAMQVK